MAEDNYGMGISFSLLIIHVNLKWWEHWYWGAGSNDMQYCTEDSSGL